MYAGINKIDLAKDTVYTHPTTKQCSYSVSVVDNLMSSSTTSALSANQGRILKGLVDDLASEISDIGGVPQLVNAGATTNDRYREINANSCTYVELIFSTTESNVTISPTELTIVRGTRHTIGVRIHSSPSSTIGDSFDVWLDSSGSTLYIQAGDYMCITVTYKMYVQ